jgi:hypothetical protein
MSLTLLFSLEELKCKLGKQCFASRILTDGVAVNFLFARKKPPDNDIHSVQLSLDDFCATDIETYFQPIAVDPGRNQIFTAVTGSGSLPHEIRRCSTKEYYAMVGSDRRTSLLQISKREHGIDVIENQLPTSKTASLYRYRSYISYLLLKFEALASFYTMSTAEMRFRNYQGRQRAGEELVNMLTNGGKKYNASRRRKTRKNRKRRKRKRKAQQQR